MTIKKGRYKSGLVPVLVVVLVLVVSTLVVYFLVRNQYRANAANVCEAAADRVAGNKPDYGQKDSIASAVDDDTRQLSKLNFKYPKITGTEKSQIEDKMRELAAKRKDLMVSLWRLDADTALKNTLTASEQSTISALAKNCTEVQATQEGTLEVWHEDYKDETSGTFYTLVTEGKKRITLNLAKPNTALISNMSIKVKGYQIDNDMLIDASNPDNLTVVAKSAKTNSGFLIKDALADVPDAKGVQKTMVLLVNFKNTTKPTLTKGDADSMMAWVDSYYRENSYNQTSFSSSVYGWYTAEEIMTCSGLVPNSVLKAVSSSVEFSQFSRMLVIAPYSCGWAGMSTVGKTLVFTPQGNFMMSQSYVSARSFKPYVTGHELGHALGVHHANFLNCGLVSWSETGCSVVEYGDPYDIMGGNSSNTNLWNAPHKDYIGWFLPGNIQTVTANGTYTLDLLKTNSANLKALKIQRSAYDYLYLSYGPLFGAMVHVIPNSAIVPSLLDPKLGVTYIIPSGKTFIDPATGAKITLTTISGTSLTLNVVMGKTEFTLPTAAITSLPVGGYVSGTVTISADATDASGIQKVEFRVNNSLVSTVTSAPYSFNWDTTKSPDGANSISVTAYDKSGEAWNVPGNKREAYQQVTVMNGIDTTAPTIFLSNPANGAIFTAPPTFFVSSANDSVGVYKIELWKDSDTLPFNTCYAAWCNFNYSLTAGTHTIWAKAVDFALNSTSTTPITIYANYADPTPTPSPVPTPSVVPSPIPTPTPSPPYCFGPADAKYDVNGDGLINAIDLGLVANHYGPAGSAKYEAKYDVNGDGVINAIDLQLVSTHYGPKCP